MKQPDKRKPIGNFFCIFFICIFPVFVFVVVFVNQMYLLTNCVLAAKMIAAMLETSGVNQVKTFTFLCFLPFTFRNMISLSYVFFFLLSFHGMISIFPHFHKWADLGDIFNSYFHTFSLSNYFHHFHSREFFTGDKLGKLGICDNILFSNLCSHHFSFLHFYQFCRW